MLASCCVSVPASVRLTTSTSMLSSRSRGQAPASRSGVEDDEAARGASDAGGGDVGGQGHFQLKEEDVGAGDVVASGFDVGFR